MIQMKQKPLVTFLALALSVGVAFSTPLRAASSEDEEEKEKDRYLVVIGADIHTGRGQILRDGRMLAKNGKIIAIGYDDFEVPGLDFDQDVPADARDYELEILDASNVSNGRV